jgi:DNA replication protein DnaC
MLNCEKHGPYEEREVEILDLVIKQTQCPVCVKEDQEAIEEKRNAAEKERIESFKRSKRLKAGISKRNLYKDLRSYEVSTEGQRMALSKCFKYTADFPNVTNLLLLGDVGTGKTMLASGIVEALIDKWECRLIKVSELFREVKSTYSKDSELTERDVIDYFSEVPLLIIDEIGVQFNSDAEKLIISDVIDGRYQNMLPTVLISNLDNHGVENAIGKRAMDRLREGGGSMIPFNWESYRRG